MVASMERHASTLLREWLRRPRRLPLVVRGARQVGKTWLARTLAAEEGLDLIEVNFERDPGLVRCFAANDPAKVIGALSIALGRDVRTQGSLLFLDEIQAAGEVIAGLRWFAEELPELPVIAAGSLLEFTLARHDFSMPVGRVSYLFVEPMTFAEFLLAHGQGALRDALAAWRPTDPIADLAFERAAEWFSRFVMVGGMPAVVLTDVEGGLPADVRRRQADLVATYRDDFAKYAARTDPTVLDAVLRGVAAQLGRKFVYSHVADGLRHTLARDALEMLARAKLCHIVDHTAANGIPLGAEVKERNRKVILLDVGLVHALLGTPAAQAFPPWTDLPAALTGPLVEQVVGQELRSSSPPWQEPRLFYWQRTGGRPAEIDYLGQIDTRIVPIECKAGAAGSLKSLHQFMQAKGLELAVRFDTNPPSLQDLAVKTTVGDPVRYRLLCLPPFLAWRLPDLVRDIGPGPG